MGGYIDVDYIGCIDDIRSTSGGAFFLGSSFVSCLRKKYDLVSLSIIEVEYIVIASCCTQVFWLKQKLKDIRVSYDEPILILCDNTSSISISKNMVMHSRTKHIYLNQT